MGFDRRIVVALAVIALILAPAAVLRALCAGHSCDEHDAGTANVPFCSLPDDQRGGIEAGFREGRSPDVLVVTEEEPDDRVPLVVSGWGVDPLAEIPDGTTLDAVAPTIAEVLELDRPHPEVRSGTAIEGLITRWPTRLMVVIALEGVGSGDLSRGSWRHLNALSDSTGVMTTQAELGSLPADPAAILTTIGSGGLPWQHGITGRLLRNDRGRMVSAWGPGSPVSVIAALGDDLDELRRQKPLLGMVANSRDDRGLIGGGNWYVDNDEDMFRIAGTPSRATASVRRLLAQGFGDDTVPDLLGVTLAGSPAEMDRAIGDIEASAAQAARGPATFVVAGTGSDPGEDDLVSSVRAVEERIEGPDLIEGAVPGGFFVDQAALTKTGKTEDEVIEAVKETGAFADAFAAITVSFARYC